MKSDYQNKVVLLFFCCLTSFFAIGQSNLVPNPGFEVFSSCPTSIGQIDTAVPWINPHNPPQCGAGTPDYFNSCASSSSSIYIPSNAFGNEPAHSGSAYAGIYTMNLPMTRGSEYIESPLTDSLLQGKGYVVSFYVSLAEVMGYATNKIGVYFSDTLIAHSCDTLLPFVPQMVNRITNPLTSKNGWTKVCDTITAVGGEKYMIIGNFFPLAQSDTVFVGGGTWGNTCCSYYYVDDVSVVPLDSLSGITEADQQIDCSVFPNPSTGIFTIHNSSGNPFDLYIYNTLGQQVLSQYEIKENTIDFDLHNNAAGIYYLEIVEGKKVYSQKILKQ